MRWITFDQETYFALHAVRPWENIFEFPARTPMQYVLESENAVVAILPGSRSEAAIAIFRKKRLALPDGLVSEPAHPASIRSGGILGLRDEPAFPEEEEIPEKRNWWRRFWDY
jgi:hypothetical protein